MRYFIISFIFSSILFSSSFNFSETRYSYAFDKSKTLQGQINFELNSLAIKYENSDKTIIYKDSILKIKENETTVELDYMQTQNLSSFFEILLLVNSNDTKLLEEKFEIIKDKDKIVLNPKDELREYIKNIHLVKSNTQLKELKLFLKNGDSIMIVVEDEIR
ncbi:MAG: hypothetical protein J7J96_05610 [Sulfurimonas sp.]|nr:hypothetical protein [Sulfurimonas sp.]